MLISSRPVQRRAPVAGIFYRDDSLHRKSPMEAIIPAIRDLLYVSRVHSGVGCYIINKYLSILTIEQLH